MNEDDISVLPENNLAGNTMKQYEFDFPNYAPFVLLLGPRGTGKGVMADHLIKMCSTRARCVRFVQEPREAVLHRNSRQTDGHRRRPAGVGWVLN